MVMDIALVRVDNRLIHGQILEAWLPYIDASCIVVVDDEAATDYFREMVMRMAVPREVELIVCSVEEFACNFTYSTGQGKRAIVLFSSVNDAFRAFQLGFKFAHLNLGFVPNLLNEKGKTCYSPCVFLSEGEIRVIMSLMNSGARIELRRIPIEEPVDAGSIMRNSSLLLQPYYLR